MTDPQGKTADAQAELHCKLCIETKHMMSLGQGSSISAETQVAPSLPEYLLEQSRKYFGQSLTFEAFVWLSLKLEERCGGIAETIFYASC